MSKPYHHALDITGTYNHHALLFDKWLGRRTNKTPRCAWAETRNGKFAWQPQQSVDSELYAWQLSMLQRARSYWPRSKCMLCQKRKCSRRCELNEDASPRYSPRCEKVVSASEEKVPPKSGAITPTSSCSGDCTPLILGHIPAGDKLLLWGLHAHDHWACDSD